MLVFFWWLFWAWLLGKLATHIANRVEKRKEILWPDYETQARQSMDFYLVLGKKILRMRINPSISRADWLEFMPVCLYADEWFRRTHPDEKCLISRENLVWSSIPRKSSR